MLTRWFRTRTPRSPQRDPFFRPQLECLEGRLAPSGLGPMDDHGNGNGNGHDHDHGGPPPHAGVSNGISSGVNAHSSFNGSTITDSFNNTINNTIILMPSQQAAVGGMLSLASLLAGGLSSPQLGSLLNDEIALGVDTYLNTLGLSNVIPTLPGDIATLKAAIAANPVESSPIGQALGMVAFDVTMDALTAAQPKF